MAHSSRPDLQLFLDRLTSRSILTNAEQKAVLDLPAHAEQVHANQDFVRIGDRVHHSCLVVAGIVGRFDQNGDGKRQITAMHTSGDMCDLHSVVQPLPSSALQALSVATILRIPHAALRAITGRHPALAEAFWRDCMVDAAILSEWVVNVGSRDAKTRVAHLICEMAMRLSNGLGRKEFMFDMPITQTQLGEATGLTAVHVNRTLQSLRADGLIECHRRVIRIPQWDALAKRAEFDPVYLQAPLQRENRMRIVQVG